MNNFVIKNNSYDILEIDNSSPNLKKIISHIKDMKDIICKRSIKLDKDEINITPEFIINELKLFRHELGYFIFLVYQKVLFYEKSTIRPTAILIAKTSIKNNSYILKLLCRHEESNKGFGSMLLNKLIDKARLNNIKYVYTESIINAISFYKKIGFESESEKELFTESEKDVSTFGYLIDVNKCKLYLKDKKDDNKIEIIDKKTNEIIKIGGNINETIICNNKYDYKINRNYSKFTLKVFENNEELGELKFEENQNILLYKRIEIINIVGLNTDIGIILLTILDNLCSKNFIYESYMHTNNENEINILLGCNYIQKKDLMDFKHFRKLHNEQYLIDRTVLKY